MNASELKILNTAHVAGPSGCFMEINMEIIEFNGWKNNVRLANMEVELIVTKDVGPRIIRFAFIGGKNLFAEINGQQGGTGENEWMIRGGHRFWIAPEEKPKTYELDNSPIEIEEIEGGIRTVQPQGTLSRVSKTMEIYLSQNSNEVRIVHILKNMSDNPVELAPWALSVMNTNGLEIIPLPKKIPHTERLTHNQEWSLWGYTDFSDPRWTLGSRYIFLQHEPQCKGPTKLGIKHQEGWVGYLLDDNLFVKKFKCIEGAIYPDAGMTLETFSCDEFQEIESLGALVTLDPGETTSHEENWSLYRNVPQCKSESDVDANIIPLL